MSDIKDDVLGEKLIEGHEYDGIKELDNPLPDWWLWLFLFTIIFGFLYWIHYSLGGGGLSSDESLAKGMQEIKATQVASEKKIEAKTDLSLQGILASQEMLEKGKKAYMQYCTSCHGDYGQGVIGPNLTDEYWLHSKGQFEDIELAINQGFPDKGMPAWKDIIPAAEKPMIAAFVTTLKGTKPSNPKGPQGVKVE